MRTKKTAWLVLLILLLAAVGGAFFSTPPASAQMVSTPDSDRLAPWPTVYPPTQADQGAQVYYQRCMVCHGDRGQGLTVEWRGVFDPEDQNCWQSGCHNQTRLPPDGFVFPKTIPAVAGEGVLDHFGTAQNLFDFLKHSMPYQAPNSLEDEAYWQTTAYLLRIERFLFWQSAFKRGDRSFGAPHSSAAVARHGIQPSASTLVAGSAGRPGAARCGSVDPLQIQALSRLVRG